ncbi:MAG TPA: DUF4395 family protein [Candidatus Krumholzibacteria bacterium]|nr:DUF4395 family protein [Candidatus Krumholzibacteria bacterium]
MTAEQKFVHGQGFYDSNADACGVRYPALMFQPRAILVLVLVARLFATGWVFVGLAALLAWCALVPQLNPFDAIYYHLVTKRSQEPRVPPAPAPRRFTQSLGSAMLLAVGILMIKGRDLAAWRLFGLTVLMMSVLVFGRFCMGSFLYFIFTGQLQRANRMLPWSKSA